jgi:putative membrane protein
VSEQPARFDVQPSVSNHFAWLRTQLALQNTLMAGVRTAVSLIGFGFTVAQFFERIQGKAEGLRRVSEEAPRNLGLTLIAAGVMVIAVFLWQFRVGVAYMRQDQYKEIAGVGRQMHSMAYVAGWVVLLIGFAAFITVFARF